MRSYKLYLYRHGMTDGNKEGKYIGVTDVELCGEGREELAQLREQYEYPNIGKLYVSPLKRCIQTAEILYPEMGLETVDAIREYNFGIYEDKTLEELQKTPGFTDWVQTNMSEAPEGGEDLAAFSERIRGGFDYIIKDMMQRKISSAGVITHGGVIMTILGMCGLPKMNPTNWIVKNGQGYSLLVNAQLWGNTMSFEICDKLPYGKNEVFDQKAYEMMDVSDLRSQYDFEQDR